MDGVLVPAEERGVTYQYLSRYAVHDPAWVYVTTDDSVAAAYASRYVGGGRTVPGDLYEVQPLDPPQPDPDYRFFPEVFFLCRRARITRRVASGVSLTPVQQREREWRYRVWESADDPVWDSDGVINPSRQMRGNGVSREWTSMLRPWLDPEDIDGAGNSSAPFALSVNPHVRASRGARSSRSSRRWTGIAGSRSSTAAGAAPGRTGAPPAASSLTIGTRRPCISSVSAPWRS